MKRYEVKSGSMTVYTGPSHKKARDSYSRYCNSHPSSPTSISTIEELDCNEAMKAMRDDFKGMLGIDF